MRRLKLLLCITVTAAIKMCICAADINYLSPNITCGNLTCYGPLTANCTETPDRPCICIIGFEGDTCLYDVDECSKGNPCRRRGDCINTIGSFACTCLQGWSGSHCENMTGNHQECKPGWTLPRCTTDIDECKNTSLFHCDTNQRCKNTPGNYTCTCDNGWEGSDCMQDVNECLSNPCQNSGTCNNILGSFRCFCPAEWTGTHCKHDIDECQSAPCLNNGTCNNTIGSFDCACAQNYTGTICEQDPSANSCAFSGNSGNGADNTSVIVGTVLGSVGAVGAAVAGVFLFKKFRPWRCNKTHSEFSSDGLNRDQKAEETPTMPGQTKFHVT